jgi:hypothetical protein
MDRPDGIAAVPRDERQLSPVAEQRPGRVERAVDPVAAMMRDLDDERLGGADDVALDAAEDALLGVGHQGPLAADARGRRSSRLLLGQEDRRARLFEVDHLAGAAPGLQPPLGGLVAGAWVGAGQTIGLPSQRAISTRRLRVVGSP